MMAAKAGVDPVEFRLSNLTDERMMRVLQAAAEVRLDAGAGAERTRLWRRLRDRLRAPM